MARRLGLRSALCLYYRRFRRFSRFSWFNV